MSMNAQELNELRSKVDEINNELLSLLNRRASIVKQIGEYKVSNGLPIFDPVREREIIAYLLQKNAGPLDDATVAELFKKIFDVSTQMQEKLYS